MHSKSQAKRLTRCVAVCAIFLLPVAMMAASGDFRNDSGLAEAAKLRDLQAVRSLLKQKADVNARQADGATALHWASHWDELETADLLIRAGANVDAANDYGITPLSLACSNGSAAMAEKLLKAGAKPNPAQWSGETPLMTCARTGNPDAVLALLSHGADVNAATRRGQTALMWALSEKHPEAARALIGHGANVNARTQPVSGMTPQMYITYGIHPHATGEFDVHEAGEAHPDPASPRGGFTPLMFAAQQGDLETARMLLEARADVNATSPDYGNALIVAASSGNEAFAIYLLDKGADPNAMDGFGFTALHYAIPEGIKAISMNRHGKESDRFWFHANMPGLVKALLDHGANPNARVVKGFPPFDVPAFSRGVGHSLPQFRPDGVTPFLLAAASGEVFLMRLLVAKGANPLLATTDRTTPLMAAAGIGRVDERSEEEEKGALEAVMLAVELGADVNAVNQDGRTALQGAAYMGSDAMVEFLVSKGAKLDLADRYGQTPLSIAEGDPTHLADPTDKRFQERSAAHKTTAELLIKLGSPPVPAPKFEDRPLLKGPIPGIVQ